MNAMGLLDLRQLFAHMTAILHFIERHCLCLQHAVGSLNAPNKFMHVSKFALQLNIKHLPEKSCHRSLHFLRLFSFLLTGTFITSLLVHQK